MTYQLEVRDNRGKDPKQVNNFAVILTDNGFKLTNNGNEILDATTIRQDGTFTVNANRAKKTHEQNGYTRYECFLW